MNVNVDTGNGPRVEYDGEHVVGQLGRRRIGGGIEAVPDAVRVNVGGVVNLATFGRVVEDSIPATDDRLWRDAVCKPESRCEWSSSGPRAAQNRSSAGSDRRSVPTPGATPFVVSCGSA